jgi:GNAT superfamily N-acetyltransferase
MRSQSDFITEQGVTEGTNNITYKQQKGKNKFSVEMLVDGKPAGMFQYDANTGRTITELDPAYRGQGLGQRLILKGIYTAAMLGMDYVEDESRTAMFDRALDGLADAGYIVNDEEYWYVTDSGEQFLKQGVAEGLLNEYRDRLLQYVKNLLPTWPEYVLKDWLVPNKGDFSNLPDTELKNGIMEKLKGAGLTSNSKWQLVPDMKFTMDMFDPKTKQLLAGRAGGTSDLGMGIPKDKERHATQAALAQQQGGVRKEPVLLIKTAKGYELLEGWHRTIQHFVKYPDGYTGPAYVAVAQGQQGVAENFADGKVKGKSRPGRVKKSGASCNGSVTDLRKKAKNASGEKAKMYHWCANMKSGKKK